MKFSIDLLMDALRNSIKSNKTQKAILIAREILLHRPVADREALLRALPVWQCEYSLVTPHIKELVELMELHERQGQSNVRVWEQADNDAVLNYVGLIAELPRDLDVFIALVDVKYDRALIPEPDVPNNMKWLGALQIRAMSGGSNWDKTVMKVTLKVWSARTPKQIAPIQEWVAKAEDKVQDVLSWLATDSGKINIEADDIEWAYDNHKIPFSLLRKLPKNMTEMDFRKMWWWYRTQKYEGVWFFLGTFITDKSCTWESVMSNCQAFSDQLKIYELWKTWMKPKIDQMIAPELIALKDYAPQINVTTSGWEIQSHSNPKKYHKVEKVRDVYSCDCEAYKYQRKHCKHINYVLENIVNKK